jgi:hypothetical protein
LLLQGLLLQGLLISKALLLQSLLILKSKRSALLQAPVAPELVVSELCG